MIAVGRKALINTDSWFVAPNGQQYSAAFGTVRAVSSDQETLGVKTNARSTNWYVVLGNMTIAGCQIHYAVECDTVNNGDAEEWFIEGGELKRVIRPTRIYMADEADA